MTREELIESLTMLKEQAQEYGDNTFVWDITINSFNFVIDSAIKALEQEPTTKIEESNFSKEQYRADLQSAYDCGKSVLDKVRNEIDKIYEREGNSFDCLNVLDELKEFINKCEAESEE